MHDTRCSMNKHQRSLNYNVHGVPHLHKGNRYLFLDWFDLEFTSDPVWVYPDRSICKPEGNKPEGEFNDNNNEKNHK